MKKNNAKKILKYIKNNPNHLNMHVWVTPETLCLGGIVQLITKGLTIQQLCKKYDNEKITPEDFIKDGALFLGLKENITERLFVITGWPIKLTRAFLACETPADKLLVLEKVFKHFEKYE